MSQDLYNLDKAIYVYLTGDSTLMDLISGVYGMIVPDNAAFPYIQVYRLPTNPDDTFDTFRDRVIVQVSCCAKEDIVNNKTEQEIIEPIAERVADLLDDNRTIAVSDYALSCFDRLETVPLYDETDKILYTVIRYSVAIARRKSK